MQEPPPPNPKWRLRAVWLVEARSDSYTGVICGAEDKQPRGGAVMNERIC